MFIFLISKKTIVYFLITSQYTYVLDILVHHSKLAVLYVKNMTTYKMKHFYFCYTMKLSFQDFFLALCTVMKRMKRYDTNQTTHGLQEHLYLTYYCSCVCSHRITYSYQLITFNSIASIYSPSSNWTRIVFPNLIFSKNWYTTRNPNIWLLNEIRVVNTARFSCKILKCNNNKK